MTERPVGAQNILCGTDKWSQRSEQGSVRQCDAAGAFGMLEQWLRALRP